MQACTMLLLRFCASFACECASAAWAMSCGGGSQRIKSSERDFSHFCRACCSMFGCKLVLSLTSLFSGWATHSRIEPSTCPW